MQSEKCKVFQDPPDEIDATWRNGALIGGITKGAFDTFTMAETFKLAADNLIQMTPEHTEGYEMVHPVLYCYRHALELYLKAILNRSDLHTHNLSILLKELISIVKVRFQVEPPEAFLNLILEFHEFDKKSDAFRYPKSRDKDVNDKHSGEIWVDFETLRKSLDYLQQCFRRIANDPRGFLPN